VSRGKLLLIVIWVASIIGGHYIGKHKGRQNAGEWLTILLGTAGLVIIACVPEFREGKVAEAQKKYEIQAEAATRAGWPPYAPAPRTVRRHGRKACRTSLPSSANSVL
jgi:hypothetical protein